MAVVKPTDLPRVANDTAIDAAGIRALCKERTHTKIAHNKFIVLLEDDVPTALWTGSTNLTEGGLDGQWNVGHVVRDQAVAQRYLDLWNEVEKDEMPKNTKQWNDAAPAGADRCRRRLQPAWRPRRSRLVR